MDLLQADAVVEDGLALVAEVAQAVPLARALRVEGPDVVVDDAGGFLVDVFVEGLAAEEGEGGLGVEGPVEVEARAGAEFGLGGGEDARGGEAVEGAEFVGGAVAGGGEGGAQGDGCLWVPRWGSRVAENTLIADPFIACDQYVSDAERISKRRHVLHVECSWVGLMLGSRITGGARSVLLPVAAGAGLDVGQVVESRIMSRSIRSLQDPAFQPDV